MKNNPVVQVSIQYDPFNNTWHLIESFKVGVFERKAETISPDYESLAEAENAMLEVLSVYDAAFAA